MIKNSILYGFGIVLSLLIAGCGQDYNSNSGDKDLGGGKPPAAGECSEPGAARFCAAVQSMQSRCFGCHIEWKNYKTDQDWLDSRLVSAGKSAESKVVTRLINNGGDMPLGSGAIPDSEYNAIKLWIDGL